MSNELTIDAVAALPVEIQVPLSRPFQYATKDGDTCEGQWVTLLAPTGKQSHARGCARLKQMFYRATTSQASMMRQLAAVRISPGEVAAPAEVPAKDTDAPDEDPTLTASTVLIGIASSTDVELDEFIETGLKLLIENLALLDGEVKLTRHLADKMSLADLERMVCEYVARFLCASDLQGETDSSARESQT